MREKRDVFEPASVDEEIEQAKLQQPGQEQSGEHSSNHPVDDQAHLVNMLHAITQQQAQSTMHELDEAWQSIVTSRQYQTHVRLQQTERDRRLVPVQRLESRTMPDNKITDQTETIPSVKQRSQRTLAILAAVACIALVVGSMLWITRMAKNGGGNPAVVKQPTTTPSITPNTQQHQVKVVYTYTQTGSVGISAISWSPKGDRLLSVGSQIEVWDFNKMYLALKSSGLSSSYVVWSPDGKSIAINSPGNGVEILDATTGQVQRTCPVPTLPGYGLPGADIQSTLKSSLAVVMPYGPQLANGTAASLSYYLAWSPDGRYLAATFSAPGSGSHFVGLIVYAAADCSIVWQPAGTAYDAVAWSPDSKYLAWFDGANVEIQNFATRQRIYAYPSGRNTDINSISWSPDGQRIAMLEVGISLPGML